MGFFCDVEFLGLLVDCCQEGSLQLVLIVPEPPTPAMDWVLPAWMGCQPFSHALVFMWSHAFLCCDFVCDLPN